MAEKLLLVDYENVQQIDLSRLDDKFDVKIFTGANQKNVPIELVTKTQKLGSRVEWFKIEGNGSNALDFHIAMHLGQVLEISKQTECWVLSKDKGFDPLLKFLNKQGLKCSRLNSLLELNAQPIDINEPNYQRLLDILTKQDKKNRPRRLKTLTKHIAAMFQKKLAADEIDRLIDLLFVNKKISETNNIISYEF